MKVIWVTKRIKGQNWGKTNNNNNLKQFCHSNNQIKLEYIHDKKKGINNPDNRHLDNNSHECYWQAITPCLTEN